MNSRMGLAKNNSLNERRGRFKWRCLGLCLPFSTPVSHHCQLDGLLCCLLDTHFIILFRMEATLGTQNPTPFL